jgi:hypothetical protein
MDMSQYSTFNIISGSVSGSVSYPITLTEAKQWLRVDTSVDDNFINMLVTASLSDLESGYGFPITPKILEKKYVAGWAVPLADFTVNGVVSVVSGSNNYTADTKLEDNVLYFTVLPDAPYVVVRFTAGYDAVPQDTVFTMLKYITDGYENRTSELPFQMNKSINTYDNMVGKRKFFYI